jgi:thiol-disulfide isomerase/thioredoxin
MFLPRHSRALVGLAAAVLVGALLAVGLLGSKGKQGPPVAVSSAGESGAAVPTLPAISGSDLATGRPVRLASFRGRPLFVNLWASWCTGCRDEAGDIARFTREHPRVGFVGIDVNDSSGAARAFVARYHWRHPSIADPQGSIGSALGLQGLPTTLFVDAQGHVRGQALGPVTYEALVRAAGQLGG